MANERVETKIGPGYHQVQLPNWASFVDYICNDLAEYGSYIWRGQRCDDWVLEPTIDRLNGGTNYDFAQQHLEKFKFAVRGRRGTNPAALKDENDWWALGQHHGLATPLLDWTSSPFVAAFFAFAEVGDPKTAHRAVFALHSPTLEGWATEKKRKEDQKRRQRQADIKAGMVKPGLLDALGVHIPASSELVLVRPLSDENSRLVNQGGLFTRLQVYPSTSLEKWVMANHPADDPGMSIIKILIPDTDREMCLRNLNRMNINHLSLFPDLGGASKHCNLFSEIANY